MTMLLTPAQIKWKSFESRRNSSFFLPGVDASHVYVHAWMLGCFHSLISSQTFRRALTALVDICAEIKRECPFSGVTKSGRVWRKVLESGARSVVGPLTHQRQFCLSVCQTGAQTRCLDALTSVLLQAINFPILKTRPFITNINNKTSVKIQL